MAKTAARWLTLADSPPPPVARGKHNAASVVSLISISRLPLSSPRISSSIFLTLQQAKPTRISWFLEDLPAVNVQTKSR